jgi:hypothetical protein
MLDRNEREDCKLLGRLLIACGAGFLALAPVDRACALTLDTTPGWNGSQMEGTFELQQAWGETFTLAAPASLQDFTFWLQTDTEGVDPTFGGSANPMAFDTYVMAWNGATRAMGPILFQSQQPFLTGNGPAPFTSIVGGLDLPAGQYVAFASPVGVAQPGDPTDPFSTNWADMGQFGGIIVPGSVWVGNFSGLNSTADFSTTDFQVYSGQQLAFTAHFDAAASSVPEPGVVGATALAALGCLLRRRESRRRRDPTLGAP